MKKLSLFNHEKRLKELERFKQHEIWRTVALVVLSVTVVMLGYAIKFGSFP